MNWMGRTRAASAAATATSKKRESETSTAISGHRSSENLRVSNGLKEFLWLISDVQNGRLLDLGPVCQTTLNFFIARGFRVTTDDMLRSWKEFLKAEEDRKKRIPPGEDDEEASPDELAKHFLESSLRYPEQGFHAVLAWDIFDYLDADLMSRAANRLHDLVHPGGAVLALFHSKPPAQAHRYRIVDHENIEMLPVKSGDGHKRVFQNREILNLFGRFRSAKTFVGRDQLREGLFIR